MSFRIFARVLFCGLAFPFIVARAQEVSPTLSSSSKNTPAKNPQENKPIDLPAVVGQDIKGITIPQYDASGRLSMQLQAAKARKIDEHQVELEALTIEFFEKEGKDITITVPHGIFDLVTKTLFSSANGDSAAANIVRVKREDFEVVGQSATFDTAKRFGTMQGHVHTEIRNGSGSSADEL